MIKNKENTELTNSTKNIHNGIAKMQEFIEGVMINNGVKKIKNGLKNKSNL